MQPAFALEAPEIRKFAVKILRYWPFLLILLPATPLIFFSVVQVVPDGIPIKGPTNYEGMMLLPDGDWSRAQFQTLKVLRHNEKRRDGGSTVEKICILPRRSEPDLDRAFAKAVAGYDFKAVWIKMTATKRLATSSCMQSLGRTGSKTSFGTHLHIISISEVKPISCNPVLFLMQHRRC